MSSIREGSLITTHNGDGSSTVTVQVPEQPRTKPLTLSVSPGRTTVLDRPIQPEAKPKSPAKPDAGGGQVSGLNWANLLAALAPPVLVAFLAVRFAKKRMVGPLEQVNLGVYKGALPLEMHSARHRKYLFTRRQAHASLFGKGRAEHIPSAPVVLARR